VIGKKYTKANFFQDLMNAPIEQYPLGTPNIPAHTAGAASDAPVPQPGGSIRLFPDFYGVPAHHTTESWREFVIDHEEIHRFTGWDDPTVEAKFASSGLVSVSGYSTDITDWLASGCQPKH